MNHTTVEPSVTVIGTDNESVGNGTQFLHEKEMQERVAHSKGTGTIISVWGDNGITSLSTALAAELASRDNKQVLIINTNKIVPANTVWHIKNPVTAEKSLGNLLRNEEINSATIAKYFAIDGKMQPNIATLAYCDGDNILLGNEKAPYGTFVQLLKSAQSIVDYVIVDCSKEVSDMMSLAAFQFADVQIISLTPDARGVQFFKANLPLLSNEQFNKSRRIFVANMATADNDVYAFGDVIKNEILASFPMDDGVRKSIAMGDYLKVNQYIGHRYNKEIKRVLKALDASHAESDGDKRKKKRQEKG